MNRRQFLTGASTAAIAAAVPSARPLPGWTDDFTSYGHGPIRAIKPVSISVVASDAHGNRAWREIEVWKDFPKPRPGRDRRRPSHIYSDPGLKTITVAHDVEQPVEAPFRFFLDGRPL